MKFSCERCKTRYSIADERVRGKVLKIRCKNCEFVISVREGMEEAPAASPAVPSERNARPTTLAPAMAPEVPPPPPPPQLEEEWYVSLDGNQAGPYTLAQAQEWVAKHPLAADLHCWSEGFEDWLPVEKVSQLRGLRVDAKPSTPKGPPPRPGTVPSVAPPAPAAAPIAMSALAESGPAEDPFAKITALGRGPGPQNEDDDEGDDDLSIGEVSRVVNLADLAKQARPRSTPVAPLAGAAAARVGNRTPVGGVAALANGTQPMVLQPADAVTAGLALAAQEAQADALADVSPTGVPLATHVAPPPKRGHLGLIVVGVLLLAAITLVVLVATGVFSSNSESDVRISSDEGYDDLGRRINDPVFRPGSGIPVKPGSGSDSVGKVVKPWTNPNTNGNPNTNPVRDGSGSNGKTENNGLTGPATELKADDVESMFSRNGDISRRCYEQALKKDPFLDVKKIAVTMSVDKAGVVNDVSLSSHADHQLGKCLTQRIKGWRFRESTSGITTRINVVFGS
ncbi:MAG TPA: GYF domain-containing protein [Kofleriaceae bacterium]|nr:GYF domain-containing protein [Kofleriaceae bacterium]